MAEEYIPEEGELESLADMAVEGLREFINTEEQFIVKQHELIEQLGSWDNLWPHFNDLVEEGSETDKLNDELVELFVDLRSEVESGMLMDLAFVKEEKAYLDRIEKEVEHRSWRAVKKDIKRAGKDAHKVIRLEKKEIKELHKTMISLMRKIKKILKPQDTHLVNPVEKEGLKQEYYYLLQIYKFLRAYERIFRHLHRKEIILERKLSL